MRNIFKSKTVLSAATALSLIAGATSQVHAAPLEDKAKNAIYIALDDEYKAWSLYNGIMAEHGEKRPFSNIIHAEKRHANALIELLNTYNLPVPKNPYEDGTKPKPTVPASMLEACTQGVQAEIENVALYDDKIMPAVGQYEDIRVVMVRLRNASQERHLRAFRRCVERGGQMGGGGRGGMGMGRGHGGGMGHGMGRGMGGGRHGRGNFE